MNNFYLQQLLVALKQQEVEQARLRKQIGRSNSSLLALAVQALRNLLAARKKSFMVVVKFRLLFGKGPR